MQPAFGTVFALSNIKRQNNSSFEISDKVFAKKKE